MRPTQALATAFKKTVSISLKISPAFSISINTTTSGPSNNMLLAVSIEKPYEFLGDFFCKYKRRTGTDGQCFDYSNTTLYRVSYPFKRHGSSVSAVQYSFIGSGSIRHSSRTHW
ncbi:hypothetical protein BASA60_008764 [Batrachochytrium salamandrivorans]|nr:hypothetical protein BASA60_008764 [Batrachochytrium salamandrivorans]